ncbi:hypothetical protein KEM54_006643, partial [Ascosphaera aggregata]
ILTKLLFAIDVDIVVVLGRTPLSEFPALSAHSTLLAFCCAAGAAAAIAASAAAPLGNRRYIRSATVSYGHTFTNTAFILSEYIFPGIVAFFQLAD